jgi:hypothetical protein
VSNPHHLHWHHDHDHDAWCRGKSRPVQSVVNTTHRSACTLSATSRIPYHTFAPVDRAVPPIPNLNARRCTHSPGAFDIRTHPRHTRHTPASVSLIAPDDVVFPNCASTAATHPHPHPPPPPATSMVSQYRSQSAVDSLSPTLAPSPSPVRSSRLYDACLLTTVPD